MLSQADNALLTLSGPGTPMGDLLRRFWMPALLSEELPERDGALIAAWLKYTGFIRSAHCAGAGTLLAAR